MLAQVRTPGSFRTEKRHMRISMTAEDLKKMDTKVPSVESPKRILLQRELRDNLLVNLHSVNSEE